MTSTLKTDKIEGVTASGTVQMPEGSVIQVVSGEDSGGLTTSSTSYVDSGLSATITPKFSSSKILVIVQNSARATTTTSNGSGTESQIHRGSTAIGQIAITRVREQTGSASTQNVQGGGHLNTLDSPSTTSATTYSVKIRAQHADISAVYNDGNSGSVITLMEIAQ
tara:strand:+ start:785 stop:1282 length:498 start_codon:yes stop_codon:yes gene_type:complete